MFKGRRAEQKASFLKVFENFLISVLAEGAGPRGLLGHFTFCVHQLHQRETVISPHICVVLTEGGCDMNDTGTVGKSYVTVAGNVPTLFLRGNKIKQWLILFVFKLFSLVTLQYFPTLFKNGGNKRLRHIIGIIAAFYLYIGFIRIYAKCHVRGQSPRSGCPCQKISVFAFCLKSCNGRSFLYVLVALRHLVRGQRCAAAWAVGNYLKALV